MMTRESRFRAAEAAAANHYELTLDESYLELPDVRLRVLSAGTGPDLVALHGVSFAAVSWLPLLPALAGYRVHLVELPGHGLSGPQTYRPDTLRESSVRLIDNVLDALTLSTAPVIGHSLGGMLALWHASAEPGRITSLVALGDPAVALPGVTVRMPLSPMTVRGLGPMFLRAPTPLPVYRYLLGQGLGNAAMSAAPRALVEALRLSVQRPDNARTVASLMHALNHFRRPRTASVMTEDDLRRVAVPTTFIWGHHDPYLGPEQARASIAQLPAGTLAAVQAGHAPWFDDAPGCGALITKHLAQSGYPCGPAGAEIRTCW